ncbi:MAG: hypothetical protein BWK77_08205, partial [Verrucomicrobia bacterium A1]
CGGGIAAINSYLGLNYITPLIGDATQLLFEANAAGTNLGKGGGVCLVNSWATSWVWRCTFRSNTASRGGGVYFEGTTCFTLNSTFTNNRAGDAGGGAASYGATCLFSECDFSGNDCRDSGGGIFDRQGGLYVSSSKFRRNSATNSGGAISCLLSTSVWLYANGAPYYTAANGWPLLLEENSAGENFGGAISVQSCGNFLVQRAAVVSNTANFGDGIYCYQTASRFEQCAIAGHTSDYAFVLSSSTGTLMGCTVAGNNYAMYMSDALVVVSNSILWGNAHLFVTNNNCTIVAAHSDIQGGWVGPGNINADPRLYPNWHLMHDSPCIDAGAANPSPEYDADGDARTVGWDMGCDEFLDSDGDGLPNVVETGTGTNKSEIDMGTNPNNPHSDGDGVPDGEEWMADTDPNNASSFLGFIRIWRAPALTVRWTGGVNAERWVEWRGSLATGDWTSAVHETPPTLRTNEWIPPIGNPIFVRVRAQR